MRVKGFKLIVVIVAVVVTLALLFGLKFANERLNIEKPLFKMYSETKLVLKPKIDREGEVTTITLTMKETDNLFTAYQQLSSKTKDVLGNEEFKIKIVDKRTPELEEVYRSSQFVVYEALAKGNFSQIPAQVETYAQQAGADARVYIDQDNIYVSMYKGDNYLYEIISRKNNQFNGAVADTMGSDTNENAQGN